MTTTTPALEDMIPAAELASIKAKMEEQAAARFTADVFPKVAKLAGYAGSVAATATVNFKLINENGNFVIENDLVIGIDFGGMTYDPFEMAQRMIFEEALRRIMAKS